MVEAIQDLRDKFGKEHLARIGIGVPGFIYLHDGVIRNCCNISTLENFPIRDEIERRLKTRVIFENDANVLDILARADPFLIECGSSLPELWLAL